MTTTPQPTPETIEAVARAIADASEHPFSPNGHGDLFCHTCESTVKWDDEEQHRTTTLATAALTAALPAIRAQVLAEVADERPWFVQVESTLTNGEDDVMSPEPGEVVWAAGADEATDRIRSRDYDTNLVLVRPATRDEAAVHEQVVRADAWDEGARAAGGYGHEDGWTHDMSPLLDNPYRALANPTPAAKPICTCFPVEGGAECETRLNPDCAVHPTPAVDPDWSCPTCAERGDVDWANAHEKTNPTHEILLVRDWVADPTPAAKEADHG